MADPADLGSKLLSLMLVTLTPLELAATNPGAAQSLIDLSGWDLGAVAGLGPGELSQAASGVAEAVAAVRDAITDLSNGEIAVETLAGYLGKLAAAGSRIYMFGRGWSPPSGLPANLPELFLQDLLGHLAVLAAGQYHPTVRSSLELLGVITFADVSAVTLPNGVVVRPAGKCPRLEVGVVGELFTDPKTSLFERFGLTGDNRLPAAQVADAVFPPIAALLRDAGLHAWHGDPGGSANLTQEQRDVLAHMLRVAWTHQVDAASGGIARLELGVALRDDGAVRELLIRPRGSLAASGAGDTWTAAAGISGAIDGLIIRADGVSFAGAGAQLRLDAKVTRPPGATPMARFGAADGPRFEIGGAGIAAFVELDAAAPHADGGVTITLQGVRLVVGASPGDGFLGGLLPEEGLDASVDLTVTWTSDGGIQLSGSAALDLVLMVGLELGPVRLDAVQLGLRAGTAGLSLRATVSATLALGPVTAVAERLGLRADLGPPQPGAAGGAHLAVGFQPPSGLGLSVAAGPVTGGGYLFIDSEAGTYAGAVQLQFKTLSLTAIGLINTKLPGDGWSFLILVAVEFPGIPLGFGISLYAVGGLVGIHRSVDVGKVRDALRAGRLDSVLFPRDPVANAGRVIANLAAMFPSQEDRLTIGVMARLGCGPGPLVTVEAGIILTVPSPVRLVVLARLRAVLPTQEAALVKLRLDVAGVLDFGAGEVSVDGALIDSRVGPFTIAGEMALRAGWGASPKFAVAAGGFHPNYPRPEGFPSLRRMTIALADSENPRIRLETYLALTPATVQVGARLEAYAEAGVLGRTVTVSGMLGFDALVRFLPTFGFEVDIYGSVTIAVDGDPWLSAAVALHLAGTAPWLARGEARAKISFLPEISIRFEVKAGDPDSSTPISGSITARIVEELERPECIEVLASPSVSAGVLFRPPQEAERAVHPGGRVAVRQRTVPLGPRIERFGGAPPTDAGNYGLTAVLGTSTVAGKPVLETFSPSQFQPENPERAVSRPEFESLAAGLELTAATPAAADEAQTLPDDLDDRVVPPGADAGLTEPQAAFPASVVRDWSAADADRQGSVRGEPERFHPRIRPARLVVTPEQWVVADPGTLRALRVPGLLTRPVQPLVPGGPLTPGGPIEPIVPRPVRSLPSTSAVEADQLAAACRVTGQSVVVAPTYEGTLL
ncbi:DUF6603 domain-containing protein [Streptomyces sp. NPDC005046]